MPDLSDNSVNRFSTFDGANKRSLSSFNSAYFFNISSSAAIRWGSNSVSLAVRLSTYLNPVCQPLNFSLVAKCLFDGSAIFLFTVSMSAETLYDQH